MKREFILYKGENAERERERAGRVIAKLGTDHAWRVTVEEYKPRRSNQQNAYLWGVAYRIICETFEGWRPDDVHEYMLGRHFGTETIETMRGTEVVPIRRSSKLNKQEFSDYVAHVQEIASEHGIFIPDPELPK